MLDNPGTSDVRAGSECGPGPGECVGELVGDPFGQRHGSLGQQRDLGVEVQVGTSTARRRGTHADRLTLTGATTATPSFTMPSGSVYFELTVTARGTALTDTDTVIVSTSALATTAPSVTGVTILPEFGNGSWGEGETVEVALTFDEAVTVDTTGGTPTVALTLGASTAKTAAYVRGSGTTELVFGYTVAKDEGPYDSVLLTLNSLALNGGAIRSSESGADAALAHDGFAVIGGPTCRAAWPSRGPPRRFAALPERHDGESAFDIELQFSAAPDALSYKHGRGRPPRGDGRGRGEARGARRRAAISAGW